MVYAMAWHGATALIHHRRFETFFLPVCSCSCSGWFFDSFSHRTHATASNNVREEKETYEGERTPHRTSTIGVSNMLSINKVHNILRKSISIFLLLSFWCWLVCELLLLFISTSFAPFRSRLLSCVVPLKKGFHSAGWCCCCMFLFKRFNKQCVRGQCVAYLRDRFQSFPTNRIRWCVHCCAIQCV